MPHKPALSPTMEPLGGAPVAHIRLSPAPPCPSLPSRPAGRVQAGPSVTAGQHSDRRRPTVRSSPPLPLSSTLTVCRTSSACRPTAQRDLASPSTSWHTATASNRCSSRTTKLPTVVMRWATHAFLVCMGEKLEIAVSSFCKLTLAFDITFSTTFSL